VTFGVMAKGIEDQRLTLEGIIHVEIDVSMKGRNFGKGGCQGTNPGWDG
jgi:hypothetical protein